MTEARFTSSAKGLSDALSAYRQQRFDLFQELGRGDEEAFVFPSTPR